MFFGYGVCDVKSQLLKQHQQQAEETLNRKSNIVLNIFF